MTNLFLPQLFRAQVDKRRGSFVLRDFVWQRDAEEVHTDRVCVCISACNETNKSKLPHMTILTFSSKSLRRTISQRTLKKIRTTKNLFIAAKKKSFVVRVTFFPVLVGSFRTTRSRARDVCNVRAYITDPKHFFAWIWWHSSEVIKKQLKQNSEQLKKN